MNKTGILLILVTALAAALRLCGLTYQGLWGDEAFSVYAARGVDMHFMTASLVDATHRKFVNPHATPRAILRACLRNEAAPPAFYALLALWIRIFGSGDFACRFPPAAMGILAVPVAFLLGRRLFRRDDAALLASLFTAVSPIAIFFSQEVRAYSMAYLLVLLSSWLLLRALDGGTRPGPWAAYAAAAAALCHTFYFAALVLPAHAAYLAAVERRGLRPWLCAMGAVGVLYAPWLVFGFRGQMAVSSGYSHPGPPAARDFLAATLRSLRYILDSLVLGPMYSRVLVPVSVERLVFPGLLVLFAAGAARLGRGEGRNACVFALLLVLVPLAAILALGWARWTLWYMKPRYHLWEAAGIHLLAAGAIASIKPLPLRAVLAGALCALSLAAAPYHFYPGSLSSDHAKEDFRGAAAIISAGEERGDLILVNIAGHMIPLNHYYRGGLRQIGLAECGRYDLRAQLGRVTAKRRRVWALIGEGTRGHGDREIAAFLDAEFPLKSGYPLRGISLTLYARQGGGGQAPAGITAPASSRDRR